MLAAWSASPARFREDANAEEDLVRGGYRDRVVIELAQNAADAAARAGAPGRLLLRLADGVLVSANTGAPLDAAGVESLSTLRASAKRDEPGSVGRFGVGFAAVLAVSDEPSVHSASGAVRWSRGAAVAAAASMPELEPEVARRGDAVPVLRLPFPVEPALIASYDTVVRVPLRDGPAQGLVRRLLAWIDDALLLTLPTLSEVVVEVEGHVRVLRARADGQHVVVSEAERSTRWLRGERSGPLDPALLADRPVEERERPWWSVLAAVPVDAGGRPQPLPATTPRVLHAPTPTDEPLSLPALLVASLPLDPTRRHAAPGAARDFIVARLGEAYADLVAQLPANPAMLDLVPPPLAAGALDGQLGRVVLDALRDTPMLAAADGAVRLRPSEAVTVPGLGSAADPSAIGRIIAGLVDPRWSRVDVLARLGVTVASLDDVVTDLGSLRLAPADWRNLYAALEGTDLQALAALPVPLVDGRTVRGPRGTVLGDGPLPSGLVELGLRLVHPDAVHPLLARLGAEVASPRRLLTDPLVRGAVVAGEPVADVVLSLVADSGATLADDRWLADLRLPLANGDSAAAGSLYLPGSQVLAWLDPAEVGIVDDVLVRRWGPAVLIAVGVRTDLPIVREADVPLDGQAWHDLDDEDGWVDVLLARVPDGPIPPLLSELTAVGDLDLVRDEAWPAVLAALAKPPYRELVVSPAVALLGDGGRVLLPSYTQWWLSVHARVDGLPLTDFRLPSADAVVAALWAPLAVAADEQYLRTLGVRGDLSSIIAQPTGSDAVLDRLADETVDVTAAQLREVYAALAAADPEDVAPPDLVRIASGAGTRVVSAAQAVVADGPHWAQLPSVALVAAEASVAEDLADVLDLPLAEERLGLNVAGRGTVTDVPEVVFRVLPDAPKTYIEHEELTVGGHGVAWWVSDGNVHACTLDGLARGLAWVAGAWDRRLLVAEVLRDPDALDVLLAETAFDRPS